MAEDGWERLREGERERGVGWGGWVVGENTDVK